MVRQAPSASRRGFTLIELLVVIAIIAILVGLTVAGVIKYRARGDDLAESHDITSMAEALDMFKLDKKTYPPDWIILRAKYADYLASNTPLDRESLYFIGRIWPNLGNWDANWPNGINWASASDPNNAAGFTSVELRGHQCLVYFLGGPGGTAGFASNPKHPTYSVVGERKKYFEFTTGRLKPVDSATGAIHPFPYFTSVHGIRTNAFAPNLNGYTSLETLTGAPFVYFTAGKNGYNTVDKASVLHSIAIVYSRDGTTTIDTDSVSPLRKGSGQYWNPTSFQIMSPGADGQFASLGQYDSVSGSASSPATTQMLMLPAWQDNRVNFSKAQLAAEVQ